MAEELGHDLKYLSLQRVVIKDVMEVYENERIEMTFKRIYRFWRSPLNCNVNVDYFRY